MKKPMKKKAKSKSTRPLPVSDQLRRLVDDCGQTRYQLSQQTGIDQASLSRFANGAGGLSLKALDALGELLGWTVTQAAPKQSQWRKSPSGSASTKKTIA